jgi:hypothetical protein
MLSLATQPLIDKHAIVGGCVRLGLIADAHRLQSEIAALPATVWGGTDGRVGVHQAAEALFLRGYAPAEGEKPIEDRSVLEQLPYARSVIGNVPAPPLRAVLARLPAGGVIRRHRDQGEYFAKTLRLHIPVETNDEVWMLCAGMAYRMRPGEIWVLNNIAHHAVLNRHPALSRTHLICDFLPSPQLLRLVSAGDHGLGEPVTAELADTLRDSAD